MAVDDGYDPTTGYPRFKDSGAPDIAVDPTEVAKYAGRVGNRIIDTTSGLDTYGYRREGLAGYDTTVRREKRYYGTLASGRWVTVGGGCRARATDPGATAGTAGNTQVVNWDLEDFDTDGFHDTTANRSRFVAVVPGVYKLYAKLHTVSTSFALGVLIGKNGTVDTTTRQYGPVSSFAGSGPATEGTYVLAANDYLEVFSIAQAASLSMSAAYCVAEFTKVG